MSGSFVLMLFGVASFLMDMAGMERSSDATYHAMIVCAFCICLAIERKN